MHRLPGASVPTLNPRITITLEPSVHAILRRLSELTRESQSAIVSDLLSQSSPAFAKIITVLEAAQSASASMKASTAARLDEAQSKIEEQLGLVMGTLEEVSRPLLDQAEKVSRRSRQPGGRAKAKLASPPGGRVVPMSVSPISNRGVTPSKRSKTTTVKKAPGGRE
jgi:hypothetical protein